ncbi:MULTISPECIES: ABC transporter permease [Mesobacillus]|uniref:Choline ABC transporter permease n=2 Tax=Mesobacillus TaxID=2675231 RepID=A0A0D6Z7T7_9BACI|nr:MULTISPECIES: ABC transporter permease [Mesobacillus]KIY21395.1 choline ABC transporter permease [Mesobacillus subterraneus]MDQ0415218.1 osmoprotectant transport system permease protein [Mesobacillus stamsii]
MNDLLNYMLENQTSIWTYSVEHLQLVGLAVFIAIAIGLPLGIYLTTNEELAETVLQVANIIMTIPSIALFGIMIPILSVINQGIGFVPAVIALILYSQLPIIRNTYVAINNVDPNIRDAAIGLGMNTMQRLLRVEIPNALPIIMAGVRQAVVMNIGIGAIAAFIGAGGLGVLINQGISRSNTTMVLAGAIAISLLAIVTDGLLGLLQKRMTPKGFQQ